LIHNGVSGRSPPRTAAGSGTNDPKPNQDIDIIEFILMIISPKSAKNDH
jgi:hypothetical protein